MTLKLFWASPWPYYPSGNPVHLCSPAIVMSLICVILVRVLASLRYLSAIFCFAFPLFFSDQSTFLVELRILFLLHQSTESHFKPQTECVIFEGLLVHLIAQKVPIRRHFCSCRDQECLIFHQLSLEVCLVFISKASARLLLLSMPSENAVGIFRHRRFIQLHIFWLYILSKEDCLSTGCNQSIHSCLVLDLWLPGLTLQSQGSR